MTTGVTQAAGITAVPGTGGGGGVTSIVAGTGLTGGTITTTGTIALDTTAANNFSTAQTITRAPAVNISIDGLILQDTTPATVGGQQFSPDLHFIGQGWSTTATASQTVEWKVEDRPVQGAANPSGTLAFSAAINGGAFTDYLLLSTTGIGAQITGSLQTSGTVRALAGYIGTGNTKMIDSFTVPTISSGFGTSPSVTHNNGPFSFSVNVGTGGVATSGVITLPAAVNGWSCFASDVGATPTGRTEPTAMTTTSVTLTNFSRTTGLAVAWTASEIIQVSCIAN
jgi:hypothetical protein